jgi:hypothetical protein
MGKGSYLAKTSGGTSASQRRSYSDQQQSNYSSQQNNNTGQSGGQKIRDTKAEEESFEKELAKQQVFQDQRKSYTPPAQEYGPPKGQGRSNINLLDLGFDGGGIESLIAGLSPKTMGFFGYTPGMANMPIQLYQMLAEGSLTNTLDYFADKDLKTDGIQFGNEALTGTFSELEKGTHKMFPEGMQQYYDEMSMPKFQTLGQFGSGGGGGGYGGYGSGGGGGGGGGGGYYYDAGMQGQPRQRGQVGPGNLQETVNQAFLSGGKPFAKGGIVSLVEN